MEYFSPSSVPEFTVAIGRTELEPRTSIEDTKSLERRSSGTTERVCRFDHLLQLSKDKIHSGTRPYEIVLRLLLATLALLEPLDTQQGSRAKLIHWKTILSPAREGSSFAHTPEQVKD